MPANMRIVLGALVVSTAMLAKVEAQQPERWRLVADGVVGFGYDFTRVSGVVPLPGGLVAVADAANDEVAVFGRDGAFTHRIGRGGKGPGEFMRVGAFGLVADTVWVVDRSQRRVLLYDVDGTPLATTTYEQPSAISAVLPSERALATQPASLGSGNAFRDPKLALLLTTRSGAVRDTLTWLESRNKYLALPTRGGGYTLRAGEQLFSDASLTVVSPGGRTIYVVDRRVASSARGAAFQVLAFGPDGQSRWQQSYPYTARQVERARADSLWRAVEQSFRRQGHSEAEIRRVLFLPQFYPPITSAFAASDGSLWLRREETSEPNVLYLVLGADGTPKGTVEVPLGLVLLAADGVQVWGVQKDEYDVPFIRRYRVEPLS